MPWLGVDANYRYRHRAKGANNLILVSGTNWTYDISYYVANPVTGDAIAYPLNSRESWALGETMN